MRQMRCGGSGIGGIGCGGQLPAGHAAAAQRQGPGPRLAQLVAAAAVSPEDGVEVLESGDGGGRAAVNVPQPGKATSSALGCNKLT